MDKRAGWVGGLVVVLFFTAGAQTSWTYHIVRRGETLYALARRYKTTVETLCHLNGFSRPRPLRVGERLKVPRRKPFAPKRKAPFGPSRPIISRSLQVPVGKLILVTVPKLQAVSVADPDIADVQVLRGDLVGILGRSVGVTTAVLVGKETVVLDVSVIPDPASLKRLQDLINMPTVKAELVQGAIILSGKVPSEAERKRALAIARLFFDTVIDLLQVHPPPSPPPQPLPPPIPPLSEIEKAINVPGVKVRLVGETVILEGIVETEEERARAEKIASLLAPQVINLITVRPLTAEELQSLLGSPTIRVKKVRDVLVVEGEVRSREELKRVEDILKRARQKVINQVRVLPPPSSPPPPDFATRVQEAIGIPTLKVIGDEKGLILVGTVKTQAQKEWALRIAKFLLGLPTAPQTPKESPTKPTLRLNPTPLNPSNPATPSPQGRVLDLIEVKGAKQIRVEVRIVEINRTALRELGVDYPALAPPGVAIGQELNPETGGVTGIAQRTPISAFLRALIERNALRILSAPSTVVLSGKKALFQVGGEVPIPIVTTVPAVGQTQMVEFRPFGIILTVIPTVEPTGKITLQVETQVSELDFTIAVTIAGAIIPGTRIRNAKTVVELNSGQTLVIGGLLQRTTEEIVRRIPVLSKIPIIGELFKSRRFLRGETELAILVTPILVSP